MIVLKIAVNVVEMEGDKVPKFDAYNYTVLDGQGGQVVTSTLFADALKIDGLEDVYPRGKAEGYVAFCVPKGSDTLVMTYGDAYTGLDNEAWIDLEFTDSIPEDVAEKLKDKTAQSDFENVEDIDNKEVLTAL